MAEIASAFVSIVPSMSGFGSKLSREIDGPASQFGQQLGERMGSEGKSSFTKNFAIGGAIAGAVSAATTAAIASIKSLASEAVAASDATDKFRQTLQFAGLDTGKIDELTKSARTYADKTVYSLADIQGITAQLAANGVKDFDKLAAAAGNLNAVAGGNAETFKSVGLVVTQVAGSGRLMTQDWNQLANAIPGASGKIQDALRSAGAFTGNFREAMSQGQITAEEFNAAVLQIGSQPIAVEAATSVKTFEGALGNLKASIVGLMSDGLNAMKPALTGFISAIADGVNAVNDFAKNIAAVFSGAGGGATGFATVLSGWVTEIANWISSGGFVGVLNAMAAQRQAFMDAILGALPGIIDALVAFIPQMVTFFTGTFIPGIVNELSLIGNAVVTTLGTALPQIVTALAEVIPQISQAIVDMVPGLVATLLALIPTLFENALIFFQSLIDALVVIVPQLLTTLVEYLPQLVATITGMLPDIITAALDLFKGLVQGLVDAIPLLLTAILEALPSIILTIVGMLPDIVAAALDLFLGLALGLVEALPDLIDSLVNDVIPTFITQLTGMLPELITSAVTLFLGLVSGLAKAAPALLGAARDLIPALANALIKLVPLLIDAGWQLLQGLIKGLWDNAPRLIGGLVKNLGDLLIGGVKSIFGIKSPSREFYSIGAYIVEGLVNGLADGRRSLTAAVGSIGSTVDDAFGSYGGTISADATIGTGAVRPSVTAGDYAGAGSVLNYYAAPNQSLDAEADLQQALKRSKVLVSW